VSDEGEVSGDPNHGKAIFQNVCAACHGYNGTAINWGDDDEPAYVGTESNSNPWEVFFKIRHGHPGVEMIALSAFSHQDAADVLAYSKTLPQK
jgi:thiosulfate dehydrogenase